MRNIAQLQSWTLHNHETSIIIILTISSDLSWCKANILKDLTEGLKKLNIAKNKQKKMHDIYIHKTCWLKIEKIEKLKKKCLKVEKELGNRWLTLKEKQQTFWKKIILNTQRLISYLKVSHTIN